MDAKTEIEMQEARHKIDALYNAIIGDDMGNIGVIERLRLLEVEASKSKQFREKIMVGFAFITASAVILAWIGERVIDFFTNKK